MMRHVAPCRHDANRVRRALALPVDADVWEIEEPGSSSHQPPAVRVVVSAWMPRDSLPSHVEIGGRDYALESHPHSPAYSGCIKAYVMAERSDVAMDTYIQGIER